MRRRDRVESLAHTDQPPRAYPSRKLTLQRRHVLNASQQQAGVEHRLITNDCDQLGKLHIANVAYLHHSRHTVPQCPQTRRATRYPHSLTAPYVRFRYGPRFSRATTPDSAISSG